MIGPAKSVPITWDVSTTIALFDTKIPCCGAVNCLLYNFLDPKYFVITFFAICRSSRIQKFSLTATVVHITLLFFASLGSPQMILAASNDFHGMFIE